MNGKNPDPLPEEFQSYDEAGEFWDHQDTTDYPDAFRTVKVVSELRGRRYEIELEQDLVEKLQDKAKSEGVKMGPLANQLLRQQLAISD